jgi:hypothetical protein
MAERNTGGRSSRSACHIPKPADLCDSLRGSASPLPTSGLASDLRTAAGSTSGPARAAAAAQAAAEILFRSPTPSPSSPVPSPMTQDDGDNTVTGRPLVFVPPPPSPTSRSELLSDVNREFFMDEDTEEPQHFYAVGARDRVSNDLGAAASSTRNLVELLNLYSSAGFRLDPVQSDRLAIELLQAVSAASNLGIIQHALLAGSDSQIAAMAHIVDSLHSQAPIGTPALPPRRPRDTQAPPGPAPRAANALSDPAGVRRPGRHPDVRPLNIRKRQRPLSTDPNPNFAMVASAAVGLPQPPPAKKARGAAAAQAGLVQMAKAFPTAPTQAIISAQHVVSGVASTAPSGAERARARIRQSMTHGPSRKEVVVITVPPVHWPDKPVIQVVNSFLGQHKLTNRVVSEARRHLGGLTLVLASVPSQADTDTLHFFFDRKSKEAAGENAVTRVEVGASRSYMRILNFPYYGAGKPQPDPVNGGYLPITPQAVKDLILSTLWKLGIHFF